MQPTVLFIVNSMEDFARHDLLKKYLSSADVRFAEALPEHTEDCRLIVLWSYRKIIAGIAEKRNIIVFHSSDLPEGRGWAPIYHAVRENAPFYVVSGIRAVEPVDSGEIIVRARFKMRPDYTAEILRRWDEEICILLISMLLERLGEEGLKGRPQVGESSFRPRRRPEENEILLSQRLEDLIPHLRACEPGHPAFFHYHGVKYVLSIEPVPCPPFPADLEVVFYDS